MRLQEALSEQTVGGNKSLKATRILAGGMLCSIFLSKLGVSPCLERRRRCAGEETCSRTGLAWLQSPRDKYTPFPKARNPLLANRAQEGVLLGFNAIKGGIPFLEKLRPEVGIDSKRVPY